MMTFLMVAALVCGCATGAEGAVLPRGSDGKKFGRKGSGAEKAKQQSEGGSKPPNSNTEAKSKSPSSTASPGVPKAKEPASAPPAKVSFFNRVNGGKDTSTPPHPALVDQFYAEVTTSQAVTPEVIKHFFVADTPSEIQSKVTALIMEARNPDSVVASYIDTVFNYLSGFKIQWVSSAEELEKLTGRSVGNGLYSAGKRTLYLRHLDKVTLLHEFRHALMHVVHIAKSGSATTGETECYFPVNEIEMAKVNSFLKKGDQRVKELQNLLEREKGGGLTKKQKKYLKKLRDVSSDVYQKNYLAPVYTGDSAADLQRLKKGDTVTRTIPGHGLARLVGDVSEVGGSGEILDAIVKLRWEVLDPLYGLVSAFNRRMPFIMGKYTARDHLREMDADWFGRFPVPLIKALYPEYYEYTQALVANTQFPDQMRLHAMAVHEFAYLPEIDIKKLLIEPKYFSISRVGEMMAAIEKYIVNKVKLDECAVGANTLIKKGLKIKEANLFLADIAYLRDDHSLAIKHYAIAFEGGLSSARAAQYLMFAESLFITKEYELAKKICHNLLTQPPHILQETKDKFEVLLAKMENIGYTPVASVGPR